MKLLPAYPNKLTRPRWVRIAATAGLFLALACIAGGVYCRLYFPTHYAAEVQLWIDPFVPDISNTNNMVAVLEPRSIRPYRNMLATLLDSAPVVQAAARHLLASDMALLPRDLVRDLARGDTNALVRSIQEAVEVRASSDDGVLTILARHVDAAIPPLFVNALADAFVDFNMANRLFPYSNAVSAIAREVERLGIAQVDHVTALEQFQEQARVDGVDERRAALTSQLADQRSALAQATHDRLQAQADWESIADVEDGQLYQVALIANDRRTVSARENLVKQASLVRVLEQRYREKHPKLKEAIAAMESLRTDLSAVCGEVRQGVADRLHETSTRETMIEADVSKTELGLRTLGVVIRREAELIAKANAAIADLDRMRERLYDARLALDLVVNDVRIVARTQPQGDMRRHPAAARFFLACLAFVLVSLMLLTVRRRPSPIQRPQIAGDFRIEPAVETPPVLDPAPMSDPAPSTAPEVAESMPDVKDDEPTDIVPEIEAPDAVDRIPAMMESESAIGDPIPPKLQPPKLQPLAQAYAGDAMHPSPDDATEIAPPHAVLPIDTGDALDPERETPPPVEPAAAATETLSGNEAPRTSEPPDVFWARLQHPSMDELESAAVNGGADAGAAWVTLLAHVTAAHDRDRLVRLTRHLRLTRPFGDHLRSLAEGHLAREREDFESAVKIYRAGLSSAPEQADLLGGLARCALFLGDRDEMSQALSALGDAEHPDACYVQAMMAMDSGDTDSAKTLLRQCVTALPDIDAMIGLAWIAMQDARFDVAEKPVRYALNISPRHAGALDTLGVILYRQGRASEATRVFEKTLEHAPEAWGTMIHLIELHRENGETRKATGLVRRLRANRERLDAELVEVLDQMDLGGNGANA